MEIYKRRVSTYWYRGWQSLTILPMIKTLLLLTSHSVLRTEYFVFFPASPEDNHGNFDIVFPERLNKGRAKRDLLTKSKVINQELTFISKNSRLSSLLPLSIDYENSWWFRSVINRRRPFSWASVRKKVKAEEEQLKMTICRSNLCLSICLLRKFRGHHERMNFTL